MAGRFWSLTRYEHIKQVDTDWQTFSSASGITLGFPVGTPLPEGARYLPYAMDPPVHDAQRKTVTGVVAPRNLVNLELLIRERTISVLESLPEDEPFDWVDTVSIELTTMMLATLFDFPSKIAENNPVVGHHVRNPSQAASLNLLSSAVMNYWSVLSTSVRLKEERLKNPGDDLVSMLAHGEDTKDMPPFQYLGNLLLLIVGGNDTTRNTMSGSVYSLNQFPEQYDKLIEKPALIPNMVAEVIRWQTPLAYMRRTANHDCEIGGKSIKAGDQMLMWYASGNRDAEVFDNADVLDIERRNARQHLSFGFGIHRCMGNRLAELQLRVSGGNPSAVREDRGARRAEPHFVLVCEGLHLHAREGEKKSVKRAR